MLAACRLAGLSALILTMASRPLARNRKTGVGAKSRRHRGEMGQTYARGPKSSLTLSGLIHGVWRVIIVFSRRPLHVGGGVARSDQHPPPVLIPPARRVRLWLASALSVAALLAVSAA
jgi:hypothetical protein